MNTNNMFVEDSSIIVISSDSDTEVNRYPYVAPTPKYPRTTSSVKARRQPLQRVWAENPVSHDSNLVIGEKDTSDEGNDGDESHGSENKVQIKNKRNRRGLWQDGYDPKPARHRSTPDSDVPTGSEPESPCPPGRPRPPEDADDVKVKKESSEEIKKRESSEEVKKSIESPQDSVDPDETEVEEASVDPDETESEDWQEMYGRHKDL